MQLVCRAGQPSGCCRAQTLFFGTGHTEATWAESGGWKLFPRLLAPSIFPVRPSPPSRAGVGPGRLIDPRARGTSPSVTGAEVSAGQGGQHEVRQEPGGAGEGRFWRGGGGRGAGREGKGGPGRPGKRWGSWQDSEMFSPFQALPFGSSPLRSNSPSHVANRPPASPPPLPARDPK